MKSFIYLDNTSRIVEKYSSPANAPLVDRPGLTRQEVGRLDDYPLGAILCDGIAVKDTPLVTSSANYRQARAATYPPVAEQLDMLWKAMNDGLLPRAEPFYSTIRGVKTQFPKTAESDAENMVIL